LELSADSLQDVNGGGLGWGMIASGHDRFKGLTSVKKNTRGCLKKNRYSISIDDKVYDECSK
jgi:hypothetical protein